MTPRELHRALGGTVGIKTMGTIPPRVEIEVRIQSHVAVAFVPTSTDSGLLAHPLVDALIGLVMAERESGVVPS